VTSLGKFEQGLAAVASREYLSPLRYPGGKRRLVAEVGRRLDRAGVFHVDRILEPFVGGGATFLSFLEAGLADEAVINDIDPLVSDFWRTVFSDGVPRGAERLADRILDTKPTLDEWRRLKDSDPLDPFDRAFKCLFLNRTSFSGALHVQAGPLGGYRQESLYKIDCRYNAEKLASRLWALSRLEQRVRVRNWDFRKFIGYFRPAHQRRSDNHFTPFWYLDPPFFHKAEKLYRFSFKENDHSSLARGLDALDGLWLLSYDQCPEARALFESHPGRSAVDMQYTAAGSGRVQKISASELIVSNLESRARQPLEHRNVEDRARISA